MSSVTAIADALELRRDGDSFRGACPVCGGSDKATKFCLSEQDGTVMFKCFDECSQQEIMDDLKSRGLWGGDRTEKYATSIHPRKPSTPQVSTTRAYGLRLWMNATDTNVQGHIYAKQKDITSSGGARRGIASGRVIGQSADCILVPARDLTTDAVMAVQCINIQGKKQTFGSVGGYGLLLGNTLNKGIPWYVAEGWASAWSMVFHHSKGNAVCAVAFGKGNMRKLAQIIADHHDPDEITILEEQDK